MKAAFWFGFWLGVGFLVPAAAFSLSVAVAVEAWGRLSGARHRRRVIREGLYDLGREGATGAGKPRNY